MQGNTPACGTREHVRESEKIRRIHTLGEDECLYEIYIHPVVVDTFPFWTYISFPVPIPDSSFCEFHASENRRWHIKPDCRKEQCGN